MRGKKEPTRAHSREAAAPFRLKTSRFFVVKTHPHGFASLSGPSRTKSPQAPSAAWLRASSCLKLIRMASRILAVISGQNQHPRAHGSPSMLLPRREFPSARPGRNVESVTNFMEICDKTKLLSLPFARIIRARIYTAIAFFAVICQHLPREAPSGPVQRTCLVALDHRGGVTPPGTISAIGGGVKKVLRLFRTSPRLFLTPPRYRADGMPVHFPCISGRDAFRADDR